MLPFATPLSPAVYPPNTLGRQLLREPSGSVTTVTGSPVVSEPAVLKQQSHRQQLKIVSAPGAVFPIRTTEILVTPQKLPLVASQARSASSGGGPLVKLVRARRCSH